MFVFNVGVHLGLAPETLAGRHIVNEIGTNNFDGDFSVKCGALACQIHLAHAANVNTTLQIIIAEAARKGSVKSGAVLLFDWAVLFSHTGFSETLFHLATRYSLLLS